MSALCEIWTAEVESHANTGHVTKTAIFEYSKWRKAVIMKIILSSYLRRQSFDFNQSWYADVNFHSEKGQLMNSLALKWQSDAIFKIGNRLYLGDNLADLRGICTKDAESYSNMVYLAKVAIFDAAMLKIVFRRLSVYVYFILVMN